MNKDWKKDRREAYNWMMKQAIAAGLSWEVEQTFNGFVNGEPNKSREWYFRQAADALWEWQIA